MSAPSVRALATTGVLADVLAQARAEGSAQGIGDVAAVTGLVRCGRDEALDRALSEMNDHDGSGLYEGSPEEARDLAFSPDTADASELAYQAEEALDALREMRGTARCLVVCGATDRVEMVRLLRTEVEAFERAREAFGAVLAKVLGESGEGSGS